MTHVHALKKYPPDHLAGARNLAHFAVQFLSCAARANLEPLTEDSHSNLGWDGEKKRFKSQPLAGNGGDCFVTLELSPFRIGFDRITAPSASLDLRGVTHQELQQWVDEKLTEAGLNTSEVITLPYSLPEEVAGLSRLDIAENADALAALAAWFDLANSTLTRFAEAKSTLTPGPGPVRCWPHHFDIATYVSLEGGDAETTPGIGVGMSPGDGSYDQPYFYVNPWPHLDPSDLPPAPAPGHWHTDGFVGAIATAEKILAANDLSTELSAFLDQAFSLGFSELGKS